MQLVQQAFPRELVKKAGTKAKNRNEAGGGGGGGGGGWVRKHNQQHNYKIMAYFEGQ